jgi:hypothetical protein
VKIDSLKPEIHGFIPPCPPNKEAEIDNLDKAKKSGNPRIDSRWGAIHFLFF